jgi:hypothetical protein
MIPFHNSRMLSIPVAGIIQHQPSTFRPRVVEHPLPFRLAEFRVNVGCVEEGVPVCVDRRGVVGGLGFAHYDEGCDVLGRKEI